MSKIEVLPHDPNWRAMFETEAAAIQGALSKNAVAVYHIGSTSIPGIYAKPIIDILIEARSLAAIDERNAAMQALGYEALGEFGITGRRYFRKNDKGGTRTRQIHVFESGSDQVVRHLAFRDYMIAHPAEAQKYSELKRVLAARFPHDAESYMDGKDGFIRDADEKAAAWRKISR